MRSSGKAGLFFCIFFLCFSFVNFSCDNNVKSQINDNVIIIFTNDVRCSIKPEEISGAETIGYSKIKAFKDSVHSITNSNVLLVDTGNFAHSTTDTNGNLLSQYTLGTGIVDLMLNAGYDYVVPSKQEFSYGLDKLAQYTRMSKGKMTFLCSNLRKDATKSTKLNLVNTGYVIEKFNNTKVALIGITTPEVKTMKTLEGYEIFDTIELISARLSTVIREARQAGADYIVVLSSLGMDDNNDDTYPTSERILNRVISNDCVIDFFIDGNSKTGIDVNDNNIKYVSGVPVYYGHTGRFGSKVGVLTISAATDSVDVDKKIEYLSSNALSVEESGLKKIISNELSQLDNEMSVETNITRTLDLSRCGLPSDYTETIDTPVNVDLYQSSDNCQSFTGSLVADAFRIKTGADIAVVNASTLSRNYKIPKDSKLKVYDFYKLLPFANFVGTIQVSASELKSILEDSLIENTANGKSYKINGTTIEANVGRKWSDTFLQVSGMKVEIDATKDAGKKVEGISILNGNTYSPIDMTNNTTKYTLALPDYVAYGAGGVFSLLYPDGNGHTFKTIKDKKGSVMTDAECLYEYVQDVLKNSITASSSDSTGRLNFKQN